MKNMRALFKILLQDREFYPIITIYSVFVSLLTLATPISVQSLVNTFSFGPLFQPLFILSVLLLGFLGLLGILKSLQYLLVEYLQRRIYGKVTAEIGRAMLLADEDTKHDIHEKANRYFDLITVQKTLSFLVIDGVAVVLQVFLGIILISLYHPFFIILGFLILMSFVLPIYFLSPTAMKRADRESYAKYDVADFLAGLYKINPGPSNCEPEVATVDAKIAEFLGHRSHHFKIIFTQNIIYMFLFAILNALLLGLGGYLVLINQLSIGQLVAAEIVVNAMLSNMRYAQKYLESFYDLYAASNKIIVFYDFIEKVRKKDHQLPIHHQESNDFFERLPSIKAVYNPKNYRKYVRNFGFGALAVAIFLGFTPWQQTSRGDGKVIALNPNDRTQLITATVDGIIEKWLVQDGQQVREGDPIVRIIDNDPNYLVRLESQRDAAVKKFEAAKEASDTARLNFHRQETLMKEGLSARKEFEKAKITYKKLLAEEASAAASLAKAEVDLSRQQLQIVTAPRDGRILRILQGSGTINVKTGEPLVQFVPDTNETSVELFIDGNDLPLVYEGRKVRLQFEGWPSVQFTGWPSVAIGSFGGEVRFIDPSVSADGTFRVLVVPDPDDPVAWPDQTTLRQGARTVGLVLLDVVSLGYEVWRKLNGFPKSMPEGANLIPTKSKKASKGGY